MKYIIVQEEMEEKKRKVLHRFVLKRVDMAAKSA